VVVLEANDGATVRAPEKGGGRVLDELESWMGQRAALEPGWQLRAGPAPRLSRRNAVGAGLLRRMRHSGGRAAAAGSERNRSIFEKSLGHTVEGVYLSCRTTTMKFFKFPLFALACSFALSACDSGGGEYVKKMEEFAEKACACEDAECTTKVAQEQADWLSANAEKASKLEAEDAEKVTAASTKLAECTTKIATKAAADAAGQ